MISKLRKFVINKIKRVYLLVVIVYAINNAVYTLYHTGLASNVIRYAN